MLDRFTGWRHRPAAEIMGALYLFHAEQPIGNALNPHGSAQHYLGFAEGDDAELLARTSEHGTADGARIMLAFRQRGIRYVVARVWRGVAKSDEVYYKRRYKSARKVCPVCRGEIDFEQLAALPLHAQLGISANVRPAACELETAPAGPSRPDWYEISALIRMRRARPLPPAAGDLSALDDLL